MIRFMWAFGALFFLLLLTPSARAADTEILYVENTMSGDVTLIEIPRHEVVGKIEIGLYPDDVTASPDGQTIYLNRIESLGLPWAPNVGESGEVIAVRTATNEIKWRVPVGGMPHHLTVTRDGRYIFVPLFNTVFVEVVDTQQRKVIERIPVGFGSHGTSLSPDGKRLYVGSMMNDHMTIIDVATFKPLRRIPFDDAVRPFQITRDEKRMYVQLSRLHGFLEVALPSGQVTRKVDLPRLPDNTPLPQFYPHTYNHGLALSSDEKYLLAAGSVADYVAVYSVPDLELLTTIPVGKEPNWIVFDSKERFAYVSCRKSDEVCVISMGDWRVVRRIEVGKYPQRMKAVRPAKTGIGPANHTNGRE